MLPELFLERMENLLGDEYDAFLASLEEEKYQTLPIVALSANATTEARELFTSNGFSDFVAKPIKVKELCACVRKWLPEGIGVRKGVGGQTQVGLESHCVF